MSAEASGLGRSTARLGAFLLLGALAASGALAACGGGDRLVRDPVTPMAVAFTDVALISGIDYSVLAGQAMSEVQMMSGGAAAGDFDADGWVDLIVTRIQGPPILYRNMQGTMFTDATPAAFAAALGSAKTNGVVFVDIENDGDLDLYMTGMEGTRHWLFVNDGMGGFTEEAVARGADVTTSEVHFGYGIAVGDYDRDGYVDLFVGEWKAQASLAVPTHNRLLRNRGAAMPGHFEDVTISAEAVIDGATGVNPLGTFEGAWAFSPRFSDLDGDGWPDLVLGCDFGTSRILWNDQDGTFTDGTAAAGVGSDENGMGSTVGDFDGDGDLDWFVTSIHDAERTCETRSCGWYYSGNRLYRNEGGRVFTDATDDAGVREGGWGWGTSFFDADNDGDLDLAMTNGMGLRPGGIPTQFETDPMRVWQNEGGWFGEVSADVGVTDNQMGRALLVFDYDRDGDLDVFVTNSEGTPVLYRNDGGNTNAWLHVDLVGTTANREGIGSRITVTPDTLEPAGAMLREVESGGAYIAQSERTAFFGLGLATTSVDRLRVAWLAGATETFTNLPANRRLTVIQGAGLVGDMDGDGTLTSADATAHALALSDPTAFAIAHPTVDPDLIGDVDRDGDLDADDTTALAALLP